MSSPGDEAPETEGPGRDRTNVACPRCTARWRHRESVGHCSACHATFVGVHAFDRHRVSTDTAPWRACTEPGGITTANGVPVFDAVPDSATTYGAPAWRLHATDADRARFAQHIDKLTAHDEVTA